MRMNVTRKRVGYVVQGSSNTSNPTTNTTYYMGDVPVLAPQTTADVQRVYFPAVGTVRSVTVTFHQTAGSAETSTVSFRLDNTTDTVVSSSVVNNAANTVFTISNLSIAVATTDYFEIKWVTPASWTSAPTNVRMSVKVYVE